MSQHTDNRAGRFFNGFADTFDSLYEGKRGALWRLLDDTFRHDIVDRFRLTFNRLGDLTGKTVLDVGCGSGVYAREALARGAARVIGLDAAPRMIELAHQRLEAAGFAGRYELIEGTFPACRPERTVDAAIVMGVMDYVPDAVGFLRALQEDLAGGLAAVSFPAWHWLRSPIRLARYRLRNCPLWLYDEARITRILAASGMTMIAMEKIAGAGQDFHVTCR